MLVRHVFVYGTLRRGGKYFREYAAHALTIEPADADGVLYHLPQGYPALVEGPGIAYGEAMTFPDLDAALERLDYLEFSHPDPPGPSYYQRVVRPVRLATGTVPAWCYIYAPAHLPQGAVLVPGGDWLRFMKLRR